MNMENLPPPKKNELLLLEEKSLVAVEDGIDFEKKNLFRVHRIIKFRVAT